MSQLDHYIFQLTLNIKTPTLNTGDELMHVRAGVWALLTFPTNCIWLSGSQKNPTGHFFIRYKTCFIRNITCIQSYLLLKILYDSHGNVF